MDFNCTKEEMTRTQLDPDNLYSKLKEANGSFNDMEEIIDPFNPGVCLSSTNENGMALLHLFCDDGWSEECQFLIDKGFKHNIPFGGLLVKGFDDETPMELLARDDNSLIELIRYTLKHFPNFYSSPTFCSALLLEMLLHLEFNSEQTGHFINIIRETPHSLQADEDRSSLLHRYCKCVIGEPDHEVIRLLVTEGEKLGSLPHGGLSLVDTEDGSTPLRKLLQPLMGDDFGERSWRTIDLCVRHAGIAVVAADFLTTIPTEMMCLSTYHLARVDFLLQRYTHLMQNVSHENDFFILFEAFKKLCHLGFDGRQYHSYFAEVYQLCFTRYLSVPLDQLSFNGENIFYHAVSSGLPWPGLQFITKDSTKAISERRNRHELPASLFAASIGNDINTTYELLQRDSGLFDSVARID